MLWHKEQSLTKLRSIQAYELQHTNTDKRTRSLNSYGIRRKFAGLTFFTYDSIMILCSQSLSLYVVRTPCYKISQCISGISLAIWQTLSRSADGHHSRCWINYVNALSCHLYGLSDQTVSEWAQILNGTSAQIGYTVPFTSVHAGKYGQKTNQKQKLLKLSTTQKKQTKQNTAKQNYPGSVAFYDSPPGTRWAYSTMLPNSPEQLISFIKNMVSYEIDIYNSVRGAQWPYNNDACTE